MNPRTVVVAPAVLDAVVAHMQEAAPLECCGLLLGHGGPVPHVLMVRRAANLADSATRYHLDPADHFAALREARRLHLEVVGFYHSHPRTSPQPSATDLAESFDDEVVHLIVGRQDVVGRADAAGLVDPGARVRAFRFRSGVADELVIETSRSA